MSTKTLKVAFVGGLLVVTAGCQSSAEEPKPSAEAQDTAGTSPQRSGYSELRTVRLAIDEEGPASVGQAVKTSDYVVIAQVRGQRDGVRYFGGASEALGADEFEAVEWTLAVEEWVSGEPPTTGDELTVTATAYTVDSTTKARTGVVHAEGVEMPLEVGSRYVLFLEQQPEPWGLTFVSAGASLMELDKEDTVSGNVAEVFEDHQGKPIDEVLP